MRKLGCIFICAMLALIAAFVLLTPSSVDAPKRAAIARLSRTLLEDPDSSVRGAAARALGKAGDRSAVDAMLGSLEKDDSIMPEIVEALVALGVKYEDLRPTESIQVPVWVETVKEWVLSISLRSAVLGVVILTLILTVVFMGDAWWNRHFRGMPLIWKGFKVAIGSSTILAIAVVAVYLGVGGLPSRQPKVELKSVDLLGIELARQTKDRSRIPESGAFRRVKALRRPC